MKKIYSTILPIVMILCLAMLSSCSGNSDETENGGTDDGILRITADKTAIQADGVEKVTFTVKLGTKDVSEESTMNLILVKESGEENLDYGVRAFSTSVPGTYVFKARYYEGKAMVSENEVTVQVAPVSRVGGNAQIKAMKKVAGTLKIDQAQYRELEAFSKFSSDMDPITALTIDKGRKNGQLLIQPQYSPMPVEQQIAILYCGTHGLLHDVPLDKVQDFERSFIESLQLNHQEDVLDVLKTGVIDDNVIKAIEETAAMVTKQFI